MKLETPIMLGIEYIFGCKAPCALWIHRHLKNLTASKLIIIKINPEELLPICYKANGCNLFITGKKHSIRVHISLCFSIETTAVEYTGSIPKSYNVRMVF